MIGAMKGGTSFLHFDAPNSETYKNFEDRILEFYSVRILRVLKYPTGLSRHEEWYGK